MTSLMGVSDRRVTLEALAEAVREQMGDLHPPRIPQLRADLRAGGWPTDGLTVPAWVVLRLAPDSSAGWAITKAIRAPDERADYLRRATSPLSNG